MMTFLFGLVIGIVINAIFGAIGGAIGAAIFGSEEPVRPPQGPHRTDQGELSDDAGSNSEGSS